MFRAERSKILSSEKISIKYLAHLSVLVSLTVILGFVVKIKTPLGLFAPLCDVGIFLSALNFGASAGLAVGTLSGGLLDFLAGAPEWIAFSAIIHGLQGFVVGKLAKNKTGISSLLAPLFWGCVVMILGFAVGDFLIFGFALVIPKLFINGFQTILAVLITLISNDITKRIFSKF